MPELPEAETIRRQLAQSIKGAKITRVQVTLRRIVRDHGSPRELVRLVQERTIKKIERRGKALVFTLNTVKPATMMIRLGMSGQLLVNKPKDERLNHTHIIFSLNDGRELRFVDIRQFGSAQAWPHHDWSEIPELAQYGPEPLSKDFTLDFLSQALKRRAIKLKAALMDQKLVAGIGNIYADEICFEARIHPERKASSLTKPELERLYAAIPAVLRRAIKHMGTSAEDETYTDVFGNPGRFQRMLRVYRRTDQPCRVCGTPIKRSVLQKRGVHFCPKCQKRS